MIEAQPPIDNHTIQPWSFAETAAELGQVAVVIPTYNHWPMVREVTRQALALGLPVFVVDDGSSDETAQGLPVLANITLLKHKRNLGKGAALLTGMKAAARVAGWALTLDADGQHRPQDALSLLSAVRGGQRAVVVGYRRGMRGDQVPWTSRWGREFSNFWIWLASGRWVADSQSGFRLYPLPEALNMSVQARRFQYEVEVLVRAVWQGLPIIDTPITVDYQPAGERRSHFRPLLDFWRNTLTFTRLITLRVLQPARKRKGRLP